MTSDERIEHACRDKTIDNLPVVYISGPMSGYDGCNFSAFNEIARKIRFLGFPVLNPADFGVRDGETWNECLARDLAVLAHADVVLLLEGWESSRGASLEFDTAMAYGMPCLTPEQFILKIVDHFFAGDEASDLMRLDDAREDLVSVRDADDRHFIASRGFAESLATLDRAEAADARGNR